MVLQRLPKYLLASLVFALSLWHILWFNNYNLLRVWFNNGGLTESDDTKEAKTPLTYQSSTEPLKLNSSKINHLVQPDKVLKNVSSHNSIQNSTAPNISIPLLTPVLRVFVYENLPPKFTSDIESCEIEKGVGAIWKKKSNFMADVPIIHLFRSYPGRTWNPNEADLFVVPYPHASHCMCAFHLKTSAMPVTRCPQVPVEDMDLLISNLVYFNQTTMARHLFIVSADYGWSNQKLERMPLMLTIGPKPENQKGKIVIPYLNNRADYQPSVIRNRDQDWWTRPRKYVFSYFYGGAGVRPPRGLFEEEVRKNYGDEIGGFPFVMKNIRQWTPKEQDEVYETYRQSLFCPCLAGDNAAQKRFFDVAMSGCIPLVISFNESRHLGSPSWFRKNGPSVQASYPFISSVLDGESRMDSIDYESFVVQVPENVSDIKPTIESILTDAKDIRRRQLNLKKYAPLFSYGLGVEAHAYNDAFRKITKGIRHFLDGLESGSSLPREGISRNTLPHGSKTHPRPQLNDRLLQRFIVVPERKLLFCYVEKVGCSMFNHLFRMLRLTLPEVSTNPTEVAFQANFTWYRNTPRHHGLKKPQLEKILVDPTWTKAVFYRDPVTRFLSAFRSKCEPGHEAQHHCRHFFGNESLSFDQAIARMEQGPVPFNPHFVPASVFCGGLGSTIGYYDFVHEIDSETAPDHVETLLHQIGVEQNTSRKLVNSIVRSGGTNLEEDKKIISHLGVELGFGKTQNKTHNTRAGQSVCDYFKTKEQLQSVVKFYNVDYKTFQMVPRELNCTL